MGNEDLRFALRIPIYFMTTTSTMDGDKADEENGTNNNSTIAMATKGGKELDSNIADNDDSQFLVRVRAQVMTRCESSGGWIPHGGGGLSNVSVRKRPDKNEYQRGSEYIIHGKRISDQSVILSCVIKKDFEYNRIMPTFQWWRSGEKKYGLTFQTAADARAFDKGVRMAIEDLLDGLTEISPLHKYALDIGDDDVFMTLDLPVERDSISSSGSSGSQNPSQHAHLHRMYFSSSRNGGRDGGGGVGVGGVGTKESSIKEVQSISSKDFISDKDFHEEPYSYVQFALSDRPHEYSYPHHHTIIPNSSSKSSLTSQPKFPQKPIQLDPLSLQPPPLLPTKSTTKGSIKKKRTCGKKRRCRDCQEVYSEDSNPRGICISGPDKIREGIEKVSCMGCANAMLYHCLSEVEGEVPPHPCSLTHAGSKKRFLFLFCLSIFLPCLCLYPPLAGCHKLAKTCALCGARHHPS